MKYLESVGSFVNLEAGIIYPALVNGTPDMDSPISLVEDEVSADWWGGLSSEDFSSVKKYL